MYDEEVIQVIRNGTLKRKETIAVAESVTSGHVQAALSLADRAMDFYQGGITTYNLGQKSRHLQIDPIQGMMCNCVSADLAAQMAVAVSKLFSSDWGLSITGYATLVPELDIKTLFAFYAISFQGKVVASKRITASVQPPLMVQVYYANAVLKQLSVMIKRKKR
jgi:nicotinamide-nucleotide amidase